MKTRFVRFLMLAAVALLTACAQLGVPPADTFQKRLAAGYTTVATVADSARTLLVTGRITPADAQRVEKTNTEALAGLDAAAQLAQTSPGQADTRLTVAITVLSGLQAFLATHGATTP